MISPYNFHLFNNRTGDGAMEIYSVFLIKIKNPNATKSIGATDTGGRGRTGTPLTGTGFWVQRVCQFRHAGTLQI